MTKSFCLLIGTIFLTNIVLAQQTQQGQEPAAKHTASHKQTKDGTISGTVLDSLSKKPLQSATIFIYNETRDSATNSVKEMLAGNAVTKSDGSFEINNVPTPARIRIQISTIGYEAYNKTVAVLPRTKNAVDIGTAMMQQMSGSLKTVNVTAAQPMMQMGVDRKIFNVSQSLASTGQTAQEVLAQIPSVSVDIDGNISVRGSSPQVYVDGTPTMLTLDQIPSDLIDKVELITNPSAKFDASTGGGGIINIVLKKKNTTGYNGGINAGTDTRGGWNVGGDANLSLGKFNVFARVHHRSRNNKETNHSLRDNFNKGDTTSTISQQGTSINKGSFTFLSLGTDYKLDKRNTFTLSGNYVNGTFTGNKPQTIDSTYYSGIPGSYGNLLSNSSAGFKDLQGELKYVHRFSEDGEHNLAIDVNYNRGKFHNLSNINTATYDDPLFDPSALNSNVLMNSQTTSKMNHFIFQADYVNPITKNSKIEAGIRGQISNDAPTSYQYSDTSASLIPGGYNIISPAYLDSLASSHYTSKNQVYAAYGIFSSKIGDNLSYQLGGRVESSNYTGTNYSIPGNVATNFKVKYGLEFFPSAYLTYNITSDQQLQLNYSRKVNRPDFFQLLPILNVSDPYNIQTGNPGLKPEFTSMYELSYNKTYKNEGNFLGSVYYRHTTNLITNYQYQDSTLANDPIVNTYRNANNSSIYGLELDNSVKIAKIWTLNLNYNLFNSVINADSSLGSAKNQRWSWFAKWNNSVKLPAGITFQMNAQYFSKTVLPNSSGGGAQAQAQGGGHGPGGGAVGSTQGYIASHYQFDAALQKLWKWGTGNSLSFTASINDIFGTDKRESYSLTSYMAQNSYRLRQPRIVRFTLSYRFGRIDKGLFKKNNQPQQSDDSGGDMGGMGGM